MIPGQGIKLNYPGHITNTQIVLSENSRRLIKFTFTSVRGCSYASKLQVIEISINSPRLMPILDSCYTRPLSPVTIS